MACSLENASDEFQSMIDSQKQGLEYLQQLNATFQASQNGTWGKVKNIIIDVLAAAGASEIEDMIGDDLDFETLQNTISYIALINPAAFGTVLVKEVNRLEDFFKSELEIINSLIDYLEEAISELTTNWTNLSVENFREMQQYELNELMNHDVPKVGRDLGEVKATLIRLESDVYNKNVTGDLTANTINNLKYKLENAKNMLDDPSNESIISNLVKLLRLWENIEDAIKRLTGPSSAEFTDLSDFFENVGENFKESINDMMGTMRLLREAIANLETADTMMFEDWAHSVNPLMKNLNRYQGSEALKTALDDYIQTKITQPIDVNFPLIATTISGSNFNKWELNANFSKLNKGTWSNLIGVVIEKLSQITSSEGNVLLAYDNIYAPLIDDIIDAYIETSAPYWSELMKRYNEVYLVLQLLAEGGEVTKDLIQVFTEFLNAATSFKNVILNRLSTFEQDDPAGALEQSLNITHEVTTMISGVVMMSDYLGLDHMSELIEAGDFGGALDLDEEDGSSTKQLLNDLSCLNESNDLTKSIGVEIRKMVMAENERKQRLQNDTIKMLEDGIENKTEKIEKMEEMNRMFKTNIKEA